MKLTRWFHLIAASVTALIITLLLGAALQRVWPLQLHVSVQDRRFVSGFHAVEQFGDTTARWTTGDAQVALPAPAGSRALLRMRLIDSRPAEAPTPHLRLYNDDQPVVEFDLTRSSARWYSVLMPVNGQLSWDERIRLLTDPISFPNDPRSLGLVVHQVALEPLAHTSFLPLWLLISGLGIGLFGYAIAYQLGAGRLSGLLPLLIGVGLAAAVALVPLDVLPFLLRIAGLLALICLGIVMLRGISLTDPAPHADGTVSGRDLPLYLGAAFWLGPIFQWLMTADGARSVTPAPATTIIGCLLAVGVLLSAGWAALRWEVRRARFRQVLLGLLIVASVAHFGSMLAFAFSRQGPDFWILFKGAREWARGGSLYDLNAVMTNHFGAVFKVPPFYGMLFLPFVFQDGERILFYHRLLNVALLLGTLLAWGLMWRIKPRSLAAAGLLIVLNFRPLTDTIAFGQIDVALLFSLVLALWALRGERDWLAGILIALATLFKIYPVLLLAFLVVKGRWRGLGGFVLGMLLFNGIAVLVMGWEMHRVYLFEVLPNIGGTTAWVENQTVFGFLSRLVATPTEASILHNTIVTVLGMGVAALVGLWACYLSLPTAPSTTTTFTLQYSQFLLMMVFIVPAAWMHYETLLIVPFAALLLHWQERRIPRWQAILLALSFVLIAYGNQWSYYDGTVMGVLTIAGISYKNYGMLLLGIVLSVTLFAERRWYPWRLRQLLPTFGTG